jgi:2-polyprenyl-3-methyl-5-hydroxy-6-metoxy-1,4-benzoquinol methylase
MDCPLCECGATRPFQPELADAFRECPDCALVFLEPHAHPSLQAERARYLTHNNSADDPGYRKYLSDAVEPLVEVLEEGISASGVDPAAARASLRGLDFGCGPGPAVQTMLAEQGIECANYDPFFAFAPDLLERPYDFVICTEVVEHLRRPGHAWDLLDRLLKRGGWLSVRTEILTPDVDFETWWYRNDETHLCFYRSETMEWIADSYEWSLVEPRPNVRLFQKP